MSTEDNKALVRREYELGVNPKNFSIRDEVLASNYVAHFPGQPPIHSSLRVLRYSLCVSQREYTNADAASAQAEWPGGPMAGERARHGPPGTRPP